MAVDTEQLRLALLALPQDARAELAYTLLASLHQEAEPGTAEAWTGELSRRADAVANGTAKLVSWDEARTRIMDTLRERRAVRTAR